MGRVSLRTSFSTPGPERLPYCHVVLSGLKECRPAPPATGQGLGLAKTCQLWSSQIWVKGQPLPHSNMNAKISKWPLNASSVDFRGVGESGGCHIPPITFPQRTKRGLMTLFVVLVFWMPPGQPCLSESFHCLCFYFQLGGERPI